MKPKRIILPNRRLTWSTVLDWEGQEFHLTVGFYENMTAGEVFADAGKAPQAIQQLVSDACVFISVSLQHGMSAEALGKSLPRFDDGSPYTILGIICDVLVEQPWKE